ncbi:tRNA (adenosine(37)-N6)-threonylcarbamoyltransferase complex dimerization subunit type 1 TsaB [Candidatus Falkowbacteria bacterium]|nr:tRNA (adenosine(37)-N6)-threonylcarbamoyltransferase complex dimerization subunit type 1 TsaB [Candidatus Falkowbacteria bacterium]
MHLIINTAEPIKTQVAIAQDNFIIAKKTLKSKHHQSEALLPAIAKFLPKNKIKELEGIIVVSGPGAFTSLRIGITIANTLAYALKIPIVGIKQTEFKNLEDLAKIGQTRLKKLKSRKLVKPFYNKEPNITKSK